MFHIILVNPEIPPNTGNVIRLAANTGGHLHLVQPLGFDLSDKQLRRAGLDYHEHAAMQTHQSLAQAFAACGEGRRFALTASGETRYDKPSYRPGDVFVFGCESVGLPQNILTEYFSSAKRLFIPMRPNNRSLNLANTVAVVILEAWRQQNFA